MSAGNKPDEAYYQLLTELQQLDFVLVELTLYLDTHPYDMQAVQQFNQFAQRRQQVAQGLREPVRAAPAVRPQLFPLSVGLGEHAVAVASVTPAGEPTTGQGGTSGDVDL